MQHVPCHRGLQRAARMVGAIFLATALAPVATAASDAAAYGHSVVIGYEGSLLAPGQNILQEASGSLPFQLTAGTQWWCGPAVPNCLSEVPDLGIGWARSALDPGSGTIRTQVGAHNKTSAPIAWEIETPFGTFLQRPVYYGQASSANYLRSMWQIVSPDGSLAKGAPVGVTASVALSGESVDAPKADYQLALLLNSKATTAQWLDGFDYVTMGTVEDLINTPSVIFAYRYRNRDISGLVDYTETLSQTFAVGDVIVMETLLDTFAGVPNVGDAKDVWSNFYDTLQSTITTSTSGAALAPIPEPESWAMMLAGLGLFSLMARRRSWSVAQRSRHVPLR